MKIRRYVAKDMRTALAQIKEELGAEAVIMSNKRIPEGVELMAAVDHSIQQASSENTDNANSMPTSNEPQARIVADDVVNLGQQNVTQKPITEQVQTNDISAAPADSLSALLNRQVQQGAQQVDASRPAPNQARHDQIAQAAAQLKAKKMNQQVPVQQQVQASSSENIEQQFKDFTSRLEQGSSQQPQGSFDSVEHSNFHQQPEKFASNEIELENHAQQSMSNEMPNSDEFENMKKEMSSIRQLLEHQVSGLMWQDMAQKDPARAMLVNRLSALGLSEQIADQIASYIPVQTSVEDTWELAKKFISQQLNTTNNDIIHRGGVVSLVGPTGVGKTTTIAKLAARFAQIHGAEQVVMISTDNYRIAGFEQLVTYGRIIGCQVKQAADAIALDALLQQFSKKKLILIDTAGMSQRDMRLSKHLTTLVANARVRIRNYLVLAANTQQRVMQENVEHFKKIPLAGCIYTKLDESLSVGEIISTSIQNGLAIGYLTDGQRVPEDIKVANAEKLVTLADRMALKSNVQAPISWRTVPTDYAAVV